MVLLQVCTVRYGTVRYCTTKIYASKLSKNLNLPAVKLFQITYQNIHIYQRKNYLLASTEPGYP